MRLNTTRNIAVVNNGCIKCQRGPRTVCLYWDAKSRFINSKIKSRYLHNSPSFKSKRFALGVITSVHCCSPTCIGFVYSFFVITYFTHDNFINKFIANKFFTTMQSIYCSTANMRCNNYVRSFSHCFM